MNTHVIKLRRKEGTTADMLGKRFLSLNAAERQIVYNTQNAAAREFSDKLMQYARNRHIVLSSFNGNNASDTQNIPGTIVFGDADREMIDLSWALLYSFRDNRRDVNDTFLIEDVYNAIAFEEYLSGAPVRLGDIQNGRGRFEYRILAGGFQYETLWAQDYPYWKIEDGMLAMNTKYAMKLERLAIETIVASGGIAVSYDAAGANEVAKDVNTINAGALAILSALYSDTRPDGEATEERIARPRFFLLYNQFSTRAMGRVNAAIAAGFGAPNEQTGGKELNYSVFPMPSPYVTGNSWSLVLPGRKNVFALKNDLMIYPQFDPYAAGGVDARIGHGRFGCVRADANQVAVLATS